MVAKKNMHSISRKTVLHFLFFFLIISAYYIAKPIRNSLFLEWMGPRELPFAYLASAALSLGTAGIMHLLLRKLTSTKVIAGGILFFTLGLVCFRMLFHLKPHLGAVTSFALYLFISLLAVVSVSLFWAVCNNAHSPEESTSSYNIIGIGGIVGGLAGGAVTQRFAVSVGTENLLIVSAAILLISLPIPFMIDRLLRRSQQSVAAPPAKEPSVRHTGRSLFNEYLLGIAAFVFLTTAVGSLMDYNFQGIIKNAAMVKDVRTAFFGRIFTLINIGGILIHLLITRQVLSKFGTAGGLLPVPLIAAAGTVMLYIFPTLRTVAIIWIIYGAFAYSLVQVTRETLYTPVRSELRTTAKFYIDTFVFRFGDACTALLLLASNTFRVPKIFIYGYSLLFCLVWVAVLVVFVKKYRRGYAG